MSLPSRRDDLSANEQFVVSASALSHAPWALAALLGAVGGGADLLLSGLHPVSAVIFGISVLFVVAGGGATLRKRSERTSGRALSWARAHPWRFGVLPGVITAVVSYPIYLIPGLAGLFGSAWQSVWHGAIVWVLVGLVGLIGRSRSS